MKYAIDFDSTIAQRTGIPTNKEEVKDCKPIEGSLDAIKWLLFCGHDLYVFTNNDHPEQIEDWLVDNGFPKLRVTNIKEKGTKAYVDDRAIRFTNWQDIRKLLE